MKALLQLLPRTLVATVLILAASAAAAHEGHVTTTLSSGFAHPWLGWDHLLAMLAVGLLAVQQPAGRQSFALPVLFAVAVAGGLGAAALGGQIRGIEPLILASLVVVGGALALRVRAGVVPAGALLIVFGLAHGQAHGPATVDGSALLFGAGLVLATLTLHLLGAAVGLGLRAVRQEWLVRLTGGGVAACGLGGAALAVL